MTQKLFDLLKRPIVFFDIESTGTDPKKDKIISLAVIRYSPDGYQGTGEYRCNPGMPIPESATAIHGITDEMVADKPKFAEIATALYEYFNGCDLGGYNILGFDAALLSEEFGRVGLKFPQEDTKYIDVMCIYHQREPRTLANAYKLYTGEVMTDAHDASADILNTVKCFMGQLEMYTDLPQSIDELHTVVMNNRFDLAGMLCVNKEGEVVYNFGKDKGKSVKKNPGFGLWMINQGTFPKETCAKIKSLISGGTN